MGQGRHRMTAEETLDAVQMGTAIVVGVRVELARFAFALIGLGRVLVVVMPEVLGGLPFLVLAIDTHPGPRELERQNHQQEDHEDFFHWG